MELVTRSIPERIKLRSIYGAAVLKSLYYRHYYDLILARKIRITTGHLPASREMAVFLIFPKSGILACHRSMLETLRSQSITPVVVSNRPLSDADRGQLAEFCHVILERPNVGYDFGGYRDAMIYLQEILPDMNRLWIFNDSTWMIEQPITWFEQARGLSHDFVGASYALTRRKFMDISEPRKLWPPDVHHPNFHYASYALCIGKNVLHHPNFMRFWRKLPITDNKKLTVRRGEMGLSQWIIRNGFTHGATCEFKTIASELAALAPEELDKTARQALLLSEFNFAALRTHILASDLNSEQGRQLRIDYLLYLICRQGPAYTLAGYAIEKKGFQFLKKSPARLSPISKASTLTLLTLLPTGQRKMIEDEINLSIASAPSHP